MTPAANESRRETPRPLWRWVFRGAGGLAILTGAIGALHMPFARPLMMRLGGCPMAGMRMTPEQMDRSRQMGVAGVAGSRADSAAPARPALGFALDATTVDEVHAWASRQHVDCDDVRAGLVRCTDVAPVALSRPASEKPVNELLLGFNAHGHLVNITTMRSHLSPDEAAKNAQEIVSSLAAKLGTGKVGGQFVASRLSAAGADSIGTVSYRFHDYFADVTAMNLPASGPSIREHYMSAND